MIQQLADKYQKVAAYLLFIICFNGMILPANALSKRSNSFMSSHEDKNVAFLNKEHQYPKTTFFNPTNKDESKNIESNKNLKANTGTVNDNKPDMGGPSQPEMSTFKSVGTDNMVNLFTGDFSYNIPLLDVGGYPVNIFYDGGVSMEQDASWVGLGWNINPGTVTRNMRGIPDDFNGDDVLTQTQVMKPNKTWGVNLNGDLELVGIKGNPFSGSAGASLGVSFNNYLGPALDIGISGNTGLSIAGKSAAEKSALTLGGSLSINASSRSGVTFSPGISLTARSFNTDKTAFTGFGLKAGTSYNSRNGIKAIQISEQMTFNKNEYKNGLQEYGVKYLNGLAHVSTVISFTKPSYIPSLRMPLTNTAISGHFQLGSGLFGIYPSLGAEVYKQVSEIDKADQIQTKPMVGYLYLQNAVNNANAVMDFTRLNDNEVTPSTPIISAPQYSYDVFSIQGEGTGGSIRAYRNDEGYVRDNYTVSKDKSDDFGVDIGIAGHYGANVNIIKTPSTISEWNAGNKLRTATGFTVAGNSFENVYFRNPGETSVLNPAQYDRIGGTDLVRYKLGGSNVSPTVEPVLEKFSKAGEMIGTIDIPTTAKVTERKKRSQVISFLTAEEASVIGLDKTIKSYDGTNMLDNQGNLIYQSIPRVDNVIRKKHHISQINVTEANGQRYIYGIPVYNIKQEDFTFTVKNSENTSDQNDPDKVNFSLSPNEATNLNNDADKDGYIQTTTTPAYAHSFLLSGLLSPDYVDVTGDGITEDDLGNAVKFNYTKIDGVSKWRAPLTADANVKANFNAGRRSEVKDDKGIISYGERESWYLHSVESKTMIALFTLENRDDAKGSSTEFNGINSTDNTAKRLKQIDLYSKADLKKNGLQGAKPTKTVHFEYSYTLCKGAPNNPTSGEGKLTLEKIYFTFNGQSRASKNQYVFSYGSAPADNPDYAFNASDRWGTYKPASANPSNIITQAYGYPNLKNSDYPYSSQDKNLKSTIDQNAGAWLLKKILLPSGGQMEVTYESDDYAFVQNKRAADMMQVVGFGNNNTNINNQLYTLNGDGTISENNYAFIKVPDACSNALELFQKYLEGADQLAFKLAVNMPKGMEFLDSYATFDASNYGLYTADATNTTIWVKLNLVDGLSPLSLTAVEFLREQLPGQAYPGYDVSDDAGLKQVGEILAGWLAGISSAFKDPVNYLRGNHKAQTVDVSKCFVRLNDPDGFKYGGGYRVKSVVLTDNWKAMNNGQLYTSEYGQNYDYTTTEIFNGVERTISSGVASYEPSLGGDENPFQTMVQVSNKVPLGPASYGAIEMPVLDAFFPAPSVGYSKVTVTSIKKGNDPIQKSRSGIGKQVTEFYTAKDFPVYYSNTTLDPGSDKQANSSSFGYFFYKYAFDSRALSQGFLVETNDMHGKMKSQASYPENDDKTPVNYTQYFYRNTGSKGFDEKFDFVYASQGGTISPGNMGIDVELMTDTREFSVKSKSLEVQGQVDLFPILIPAWLPFIWPVVGETENTYRAVTATKVISYHSILDNVIVIDKGSQVSTKNLVYDAETGDVIVNQTNNEFNQPIYSTNYPAWWAYSGMGPAYKNIDAVYSSMNFYDGKLMNLANQNDIIESGDELLVTPPPAVSSSGCVSPTPTPPPGVISLWAFDKNKNTSSLTDESRDLVFMDKDGKLYTCSGVTFKIVRSGKRNMLSFSAASAVTMASPIVNNKLTIDQNSKVVNATAVEFKEKWQTDNDVFKKYRDVVNPNDCSVSQVEDCNGYLEKSINPYIKGLLGTFRTQQSKVFYDNRKETNPVSATNVAANGFLDNFQLYWNFNTAYNLVPDLSTGSKWVYQSEITKLNSKGLELETKNALGIYTGAQYGFNKTMPVAITNNSRDNDMFAEGFEDNNYDERLNLSSFNNCTKKHIDFNSLNNNSTIISVDGLGFKAHTGKNVLQIGANTQALKAINLSGSENPPFAFDFQQETTKQLNDIGGNIDNVNMNPFNPTDNSPNYTSAQALWEGKTQFSNGGFNVPSIVISDNTGNNNQEIYHQFTVLNSYYINVLNSGTYNFTLQYGWNSSCNLTYHALEVSIENIQQGVSGIYLDLTNIPSLSQNVFLCKGIYKISSAIYNDLGLSEVASPQTIPYLTFSGFPSPSGSCVNDLQPISGKGYYCPYGFQSIGVTAPGSWGYGPISLTTNAASTNYKSLTTVNGCTYTKPIPATDEMQNPIFSPSPGKKMLFSAWVHENCGNGSGPCTLQSFTNSSVNITFSDGSSIPAPFIPVGPIIDGWQKIEGDFLIPAGATALNLNFINSSSEPIYFDDIRMHPFNADMKSYVYDPVNLRLVAELDANNYATFYEYDDEGTLIRTKAETKEGIKTITETRSAKQKNITTIQ